MHLNCVKIISKYVGESENKIQELFQTAKTLQPAVIAIDDIHSLCNKKMIGT